MSGCRNGIPGASLAFVVVALSAVVLCNGTASAETFTVNSVVDSVDINPGDGACSGFIPGPMLGCTLRAAIMEANALSGDDTINLPAGTYVLARTGAGEDAGETGDLDIEGGSVELVGEGASRTIIDANWIDRVLHVHAGTAVRLLNLTIQGGYVYDADGGGVLNDGSVTFEHCVIKNNTAYSSFMSARGGGLSNTRFAYVTRSSLLGNTTDCGSICDGSAIYSTGSTLEITGSTISDTTGGSFSGIYADDARITNSTLHNIQLWAHLVHLESCTLSFPGGEAILASAYQTVVLANTLVHSECSTFGSLGVISQGGNIESPGNTCGLLHQTDQVNIADPLLGPLGKNGGSTQTYALLPGSPAVNGGINIFCPTVDQRGAARNDGTCDVGSYEHGVLFLDGFESADTAAWSQAVE